MDLMKAVGRRGGLWGCVREVKRRGAQGRDTGEAGVGGGEGGYWPLGESGGVHAGRPQWGFVFAELVECSRL